MGSSCSKPNEDAAVEMIEHHKSRASTIILHEAETSGDDAPTGWCCCGPREKNVGGYHVAGHEAGILSHSSSRRLSLPAGMVVEDYAENNSGSGEDDVPCDAHPAPRRAPSFGRDGPFPVLPATSSTDPFASPSNDGSSRGGGGKHLISVALPLQQSTKERIFGKSSRTSPDQTAAKEPSTGFPSGLGPIIIRWDVAVELSWSGPCGSIQDTTMTDVTKAGALNCRQVGVVWCARGTRPRRHFPCCGFCAHRGRESVFTHGVCGLTEAAGTTRNCSLAVGEVNIFLKKERGVLTILYLLAILLHLALHLACLSARV